MIRGVRGSGDFSYEFARYEQAPNDVQNAVIAAAAEADAAEVVQFFGRGDGFRGRARMPEPRFLPRQLAHFAQNPFRQSVFGAFRAAAPPVQARQNVTRVHDAAGVGLSGELLPELPAPFPLRGPLFGKLRPGDVPAEIVRPVADFGVSIAGIVRSQRQRGFEFFPALRREFRIAFFQSGELLEEPGGFRPPAAPRPPSAAGHARPQDGQRPIRADFY